jgi:predicted nuclease of predicted toxin-antitoxin system
MTLRLLVDECLGRDLVERLRAAGHDVVWVKEVAANASDGQVITMGFAERRIVVTDDYDFGDLVFRDGAPAIGIVIIASDAFDGGTQRRNIEVTAKVARLEGDLEGYVTIVEPKRARQRRLTVRGGQGTEK